MASSTGQALHPGLFPIILLLSRLRPASSDAEEGDAQASITATTGTGSGSTGSGEGAIDVQAAFAPLLLTCTRSRHLFVRRMAARALASLVAADRADKAAASLLGVVEPVAASKPAASTPSTASPAAGSDNASAGHGAVQAAGARVITPNEVHGALCQCRHLLLSACRVASTGQGLPPSAFTAIATRLTTVLSSCLAGNPAFAPQPTVAEAMALVASVHEQYRRDVARGLEGPSTVKSAAIHLFAAGDALADALLSGTLPVALAGNTIGSSLPVDTLPQSGGDWNLRACGKYSAERLLPVVFGPDSTAASAAATRLAALLAHSVTEVRIAAARACKIALKHACSAARRAAFLSSSSHSDSAAAAPCVLVCALLERLQEEEDVDAIQYCAHSLSLLIADSGTSKSALEAVGACTPAAAATLFAAFHACSDPRTRVHMLTVLGALMPHYACSGSASAGIVSSRIVAAFAEIIASAARDSRQYVLRLGAARALSLCTLLTRPMPDAPSSTATGTGSTTGSGAEATAAAATPYVSLWESALTLLVDGDDEVREAARTAIASAYDAVVASLPAADVEALQAKLRAAEGGLPSPLPTMLCSEAITAARDAGSASLVADTAFMPLGLLALTALGARGSHTAVAALLKSLVAAPLLGLGHEMRHFKVAAATPSSGSAISGSASSVNLSRSLMHRQLFTPDKANEYAEPLLLGVLALQLLHACGALAVVTSDDVLSARTAALTDHLATLHASRAAAGVCSDVLPRESVYGGPVALEGTAASIYVAKLLASLR